MFSMGELRYFRPKTRFKTFFEKRFVDPKLAVTALDEFTRKFADVFDISVARSKCGEREGKIQFLVLVFFNFVR